MVEVLSILARKSRFFWRGASSVPPLHIDHKRKGQPAAAMGTTEQPRVFDFYELDYPPPLGADQFDYLAPNTDLLASLLTEAAERTMEDPARCPPEKERRGELRSRRVMPIAVFLSEDNGTSILVGFTRDVSRSGMGLVTTHALPLGNLALVVGDPGQPFAVAAECLYSREFGFGCYQSGLRIGMPLRGAEYTPLLQYFACLTMTIGDG